MVGKDLRSAAFYALVLSLSLCCPPPLVFGFLAFCGPHHHHPQHRLSPNTASSLSAGDHNRIHPSVCVTYYVRRTTVYEGLVWFKFFFFLSYTATAWPMSRTCVLVRQIYKFLSILAIGMSARTMHMTIAPAFTACTRWAKCQFFFSVFYCYRK